MPHLHIVDGNAAVNIPPYDPTTPKLDPFDLTSLRLDQSFLTRPAAKPQLNQVQVRKPSKTEFVRTHKDPSHRLVVGIIEMKEDKNELYITTGSMTAELSRLVWPVELVTTITRQGVPFLWPTKLAGPDGKHNDWHRTACEAASSARDKWICLVANQGNKAYDVFEAQGVLPEPVWPEWTFDQMLRVGFRGKIIDSNSHPMAQRLHGLV
jgi:hypothetical protein